MQIVFMGTPEFALPSLETLIKQEEVTGIVTQPDRPKGRGKKIVFSPVKIAAEKYKIPLCQPLDLTALSFTDWLRERDPEIIVVVAYGQLLPAAVLNFSPRGCLNAHASLLPCYRGAAPIERAIINGEKQTGVTIIVMNEGMDEGDIVLQETVNIGLQDTAGVLTDTLADLSARLLLQSLNKLKAGNLKTSPQDNAKVTYASCLKKSDGLIDWQSPAIDIHNRVRGLNPRLGAYTYIKAGQGGKERLKIWQTELISDEYESKMEKKRTPGEIIEFIKGKGLLLFTGEGLLLVQEVQGENSRKMSIGEYIQGHLLPKGSVLGGN